MMEHLTGGEDVRCGARISSRAGCSATYRQRSGLPQEPSPRVIRAMLDVALRDMGPQFEAMSAQRVGRPSIAPEKLLAGAVAAGTCYSRQRADADGAIKDYNLLFSLVCGNERRRCMCGT